MKRTLGLIPAALGLFLFALQAQAGWTPAQRLTWTSGASSRPALAIDSNDHIHVVWSDDSPGNPEIYYKKSLDGGATWTAGKKISETSGASYEPAIAVDSSGNPHVAWQDNSPGSGEIYYRKSTDGGSAWMAARRLTWTAGWSYRPALVIDSSDDLHIVWEDWTPGNPEIYYKRSMDGGTTWTSGIEITWTAKNSWGPAMAVDSSDNLHVVWEDNTPSNFDIYYKKSPDAGATWMEDKRLSWNSGWSAKPAVSADSASNVHIAWQDDTPGNNEVYYKKSTDGGVAWTASKRLTWNSGASASPAVAADSAGNVHIVWQDATPGAHDIYYKKSPDSGDNWGTGQRLTWNSGDSMYPAVAADSFGNIHLVWADDTPGNAEIYYRKNVK
ncbi:MAG: hypothetical protein A2Y69_05560 [Candidatus Aminicenantes bacterium RBG_13_59_9]|nr:MAG: hypothetical protein A2Y69_05560 [Candidatus Aminicenantes bacterium RBG_13_59_9]